MRIVDDTDAYFIGGGVNALFSDPRAGGTVKTICALGASALGVELAMSGDTLYVVSIGGSISSIKKNGEGGLKFLDIISSQLGPNRNAIWAEVDGNFLYVVIDATESITRPVFD